MQKQVCSNENASHFTLILQIDSLPVSAMLFLALNFVPTWHSQLASTATMVAIEAHATSPNADMSHRATTRTTKPPVSVALVLNTRGTVVFKPNTLSCYATIIYLALFI